MIPGPLRIFFSKSVRLRLLVLALLPLVIILPLVLAAGMNRWASKFDELLISNVESDLRIAEQYLGRLMATSADEMRSLAGSVAYMEAARTSDAVFKAFLKERQKALGLDFVYYLTPDSAADEAERWPVIAKALAGASVSEIDIFSADDLAGVSSVLKAQARVSLIPTEAAVPTNRTVEDRGMVIHTATSVQWPEQGGIVVGGKLLNRNLEFIDTINDLVFRESGTEGARAGTATLFLDDVRVSTNVRLFENVRALGTRVSAIVRRTVLGEGKTWLDRAFVVNNWYISGYLPLTDSFGKRVGMLYVGFLEEPFQATKQSAYLSIILGILIVIGLSVPIFLRMARGIFRPLEIMTRIMHRVEKGDLEARIGKIDSRDEIGQVAGHLDELLDQIQERDHALRSWADELNSRVDERTEELRDANRKLEATFQQLVMSEKLASIGEITAGVAHEINNPVAVIQGNLDVIREILSGQTDEVTTELQLIDQQVHRINVIVGKLLQFARPSDFSDYAEAIDVEAVLEDSLVLVDHMLSKTEIELERVFHDAPMVQINTGELQQVLINLLVNAIQAIDGPGLISIHIGSEERDERKGARILVQDSGPGIAAEKLETVFDPFFTTKLGEGTGLGLSISQTLIQRAGGLITVKSRSGEGACFSIWLPASNEIDIKAAE
ncbi:sensor histidine kinase [Coralliovum pocilloporae]|uniref:sensor histidine kinase n=1 Tax=Coralliovum pocilloporae TaxID=3066369 RepID=UPI003307A8FE